MSLCRSAFSTYHFGKLVRLSVLSLFFDLNQEDLKNVFKKVLVAL